MAQFMLVSGIESFSDALTVEAEEGTVAADGSETGEMRWRQSSPGGL